MGSHICLGGVIYTLGVNDRGSHLCLGVIYASDTGATRNATISVLNALLDRVLQQTESVPVTRSGTSRSGREMMLDSAG